MSESSKVLETALTLVEFEISDLKQQLKDERTNAAHLRFALKMLNAWGGRGGQYDSEVVLIVSEWVNAGMTGPVPWPGNPFFEQWAKQQGWSNVGGFVGIDVAFAKSDGSRSKMYTRLEPSVDLYEKCSQCGRENWTHAWPALYGGCQSMSDATK